MAGGFPYGTKVKNKKTEKIGAVVYSQADAKDSVSVQYDGESWIMQEDARILEMSGQINPEVSEKCSGCIFLNGFCLRYTSERIIVLCRNSGEKKVPTRIYPYCKEF